MRRVLACLSLAILVACTTEPPAVAFDVLIVNGDVFDGSHRRPQQHSIGISDGRIVAIDAPADAIATTIIDAAGKIVVPGFIDPHTHATVDASDSGGTAYHNFLTQGVTTVVVGNDGRGIPDRQVTLAALAERGVGTNIAFLAGHGTIRKAILGLENREPNESELQEMLSLLAIELEAGALGLSTGLYYAPGSFSKTEEVIALARTAAKAGGIYESHLRDESSYTVGLVAAVEEAIRIAREADIAVHISHIKALGQDAWGQSADVIALVNEARESGLDITANQYPWTASGVGLSSALIPRWVMEGSIEEMHARLRNSELLPKIRSEVKENLRRRGGPQALLITSPESAYRGKTLEEISALLDTDAIDTAIELVISESPGVVSFVMHQEDIDAFAMQNWVMTGSDAGTGHPRKYATYPKVVQDFVQQRNMMSLSRFVHRSSGQVADTLGLCDRGYIRPGAIADIAVIDVERFLPLADYENPAVLSTGVDDLLVNGIVAIRGGALQDTRAGQVLRRDMNNCEG